MTKWRFTAVSIEGSVIMKGVFECPYTDAFQAAAAFVQQYSGWTLKTISIVKARSRA